MSGTSPAQTFIVGNFTACYNFPHFFILIVCRFILENWVLDRWVRNILTVYPVVIVALVGNVWKHFHPEDPTANAVFMGTLVQSSTSQTHSATESRSQQGLADTLHPSPSHSSKYHFLPSFLLCCTAGTGNHFSSPSSFILHSFPSIILFSQEPEVLLSSVQ